MPNLYYPEIINQIIRNRRSVYTSQYSDQVIDDAIVLQILENANWAPTHKRTEPWRFFVFKGESLEKLGQFQAELYKKRTSVENFKESQYEKLLETPTKASHVIAIGMKRHENANIPEMEEIAAVACAVQNMYLTATAYGVGSYWSTGGGTFDEEAKVYFGLEASDKLMGFFYLGYRKADLPEGTRKPIGEKVKWM